MSEPLPSPESEPSPSAKQELCSIEALEQELESVKAELEEYQGLIEELPSIYEGKFQHQLRDVAQNIRRLLDERQGLQQQIERALQGGESSAALPAAAVDSSEDPTPSAVAPEPAGSEATPAARQGPARLILLSAITALVVAALVAALGLWNRSRTPQLAAPAAPTPAEPAPPAAEEAEPPSSDAAPLSPDSLRLRAQGECWLELQTLDGRRVFMGTLQKGEERRLALGDGLRLLAGRPDLLELAIGTNDFSTFGSIEQIEWTTLRPQDPVEDAS
jgi:hypothetical protein